MARQPQPSFSIVSVAGSLLPERAVCTQCKISGSTEPVPWSQILAWVLYALLGTTCLCWPRALLQKVWWGALWDPLSQGLLRPGEKAVESFGL